MTMHGLNKVSEPYKKFQSDAFIKNENTASDIKKSSRKYDADQRDTLELTSDIQEANEMATLQYTARHNQIVARQQAEALSDENKRMSRAIEIMSRLASGAKVSEEDLQFLREYNPEMYRVAMESAMMAERKEMQEEKHLAKQHEESGANEASEDYTKELEELKNTFTETTLTVSFENGVQLERFQL